MTSLWITFYVIPKCKIHGQEFQTICLFSTSLNVHEKPNWSYGVDILPTTKTCERPRILLDKGGGKRSGMTKLANSVISLGKHHESGLKAIVGMGETKKNPIEIDNTVYTFTFEREEFKTTFPTGDSHKLMKDLMIEVQKDRCSGVFNFSSQQV